MAYFDWNQAKDDCVNALFIADLLDSNKRGPGKVFKPAKKDERKQQLLYSKM
jgi:hypothetical protein